MSDFILQVQGLRKRHGAIEAVRDLSFAVKTGEIFGLLGPNGAGKTTTLECISGLREPDAGSITLCGLDARAHPREARSLLGVSLQHTYLQDKMTPREAFTLFASFYKDPDSVDSLLDRFDLKAKADAAYETLSGGQKQRVALGLAFVNQPRVVLLDEPTAGLDPLARQGLQAEIRRMKQEGGTVLLATHYLEEAESLCDRVAIIDRGVLLACGSPGDLTSRSTSQYQVALETRPALPLGSLERVSPVESLVQEGTSIRFQTPEPLKVVPEVTALLIQSGVELIDLRVQKPNLEKVFLDLTAKTEVSADT